MIIYSKTLWGLPLLTRIYGSALPRAIAPALVAGFITLGLTFVSDQVRTWWYHPFAYNAFVLLVSFVLTFRSNYAYQRHWEAYSNMQTMASKWVDAAMQIVMFDRHPQRSTCGSNRSAPLSAAELVPHRAFIAELVHLISLLHAVSCQALRRDPDLHNLTRHSKYMEAPPSDPALLRASAGSGSAAAAAAAPGAGGAAAAGSSDSSAAAVSAAGGSAGAVDPTQEEVEGGVSGWGVISSWGRGTNIVGSANWRDIFMLRGSSETIRKYNAAQPLPVIGGASVEELSCLGCSRHHYSSDWHEMSLQQQHKQQQQTLPRARSLSQLFTAGSQHNSSSNSHSHIFHQGRAPTHSYSRSSTPDLSFEDTTAAPDTNAAANLSFQQQQCQQGMVTYEAWGGPVLGRYPGGQVPQPAPPSPKSGSSGRCWPRQKQKQPDHQQQEDSAADHIQHGDQQHQDQGGRAARVARRFVSADGGFASRQGSHVSISTSALRQKFKSFSFPSSSGVALDRLSSSSGGKQQLHPMLKRIPSTRYLLISRNCSCCKGHLPYMDRPLLVMAWLHELLLERQSEGGLQMPAPILSRVYTCLSEGLHGFEQCRKLADTPFPFPWAQFVLLMLVLFSLTLPLLILAYVPNSTLAVVLTVVTVATYWTVNEVARDVEDPFLYEPNDMPLANSQYHINELLLSLAHTHRPSSSISSLRRAATPQASHSRPHSNYAAAKQQPPPTQQPPLQPLQQQTQQQQEHGDLRAARGQQYQYQPEYACSSSQADPTVLSQPGHDAPQALQQPDMAAAVITTAAAAAARAEVGPRGTGLDAVCADDSTDAVEYSCSSLGTNSSLCSDSMQQQQQGQLWQAATTSIGSYSADASQEVAAAGCDPLSSFGSITGPISAIMAVELESLDIRKQQLQQQQQTEARAVPALPLPAAAAANADTWPAAAAAMKAAAGGNTTGGGVSTFRDGVAAAAAPAGCGAVHNNNSSSSSSVLNPDSNINASDPGGSTVTVTTTPVAAAVQAEAQDSTKPAAPPPMVAAVALQPHGVV